MNTGVDADLARAYLAARYRLFLPGDSIDLRIGVASVRADGALQRAGCRSHWAIVTPFNPRSRQLGDAGNAARLARFAVDLERSGWLHVDSLASADDGAWPEAGFCIFDAPLPLMLARRYGQNAIVSAALGAAPALVWIGAA